jgi:hypothetical protein
MRRPLSFLLITAGFALTLLAILWMLTPEPAEAQCGSQASSCKNCHEVEQQYSVNSTGAWHTDHAFGDFCQFCHGGNVQSTDQATAHADMFYPLTDPSMSCAACHPSDYTEQAQVYATTLGITLGSSGPAESNPNDEAAMNAAATAIYAAPASGQNAQIINYNRRYERDVLGKKDPLNWKNGILAVMALVMTGGLGLMIWRFEDVRGTVHTISQSPFLQGNGDAPKPTPPDSIPGLDRPVTPEDLEDM